MSLKSIDSAKTDLRNELRQLRRDHVAGLPDAVRALVFHRPPSPVCDLVSPGVTIGLYHAAGSEAPTLGYARWFHEHGYQLALPWFENSDSPMKFRAWEDPYDDSALEPGPFGTMQPPRENLSAVPDVVLVPLVGFSAAGDRLGQGGGHYDRWLAEHPAVTAIGLGWDCQLCESLPVESHDRRLTMIVTPTRTYAADM